MVWVVFGRIRCLLSADRGKAGQGENWRIWRGPCMRYTEGIWGIEFEKIGGLVLDNATILPCRRYFIRTCCPLWVAHVWCRPAHVGGYDTQMQEIVDYSRACILLSVVDFFPSIVLHLCASMSINKVILPCKQDCYSTLNQVSRLGYHVLLRTARSLPATRLLVR